MVRTYYAQPQMDVVEKDHPKGVYGLKEITYPAQEQGGPDIVISLEEPRPIKRKIG